MLRRGQALVVVLLILGIAVTVGLSVVSRSVTDVTVSTGEEESAKALEAAEAGVERALGGVIAVDGPPVIDNLQESSFNVTNTAVGDGSVYEVPNLLAAGDVATIQMDGFTGPPPYPNFVLCWENVIEAADPAVEVMLYFRRGGVIGVGRQGYDPNPVRLTGFLPDSMGNCPGGFSNYNFHRRFDLEDFGITDLSTGEVGVPVLMRVRMLLNTVPQGIVLVVPSGNLPIQGSEIISTGQAGGSTQKLRVLQTNPDLPMMFDTALFSGGSLTQP